MALGGRGLCVCDACCHSMMPWLMMMMNDDDDDDDGDYGLGASPLSVAGRGPL